MISSPATLVSARILLLSPSVQLCPAPLKNSQWCGDAKLGLTTCEAADLAHTVPGLGLLRPAAQATVLENTDI